MRLADVPIPTTTAARAAEEVATAYCSAALANHSVRSYLFAVGFAEAGGLQPDLELLWVAALLHDVGLVAAFDNVSRPFEVAGGDVAWVLAAGAGWPADRRRRAAEVIERHMWTSVDPALDVEGHLLEVATGLDISGSRTGVLPQAFLHEVLAAHPRLDLGAEFTERQEDQAARKPTSAACRLVSAGLAARMRAHPLEAD